MAGGDRQLAFTTGPVPTSVQVSGPDRVTPKTVNASFDGTGAAGPFLPCLIITGRTGHEVARIPAPQVAAGASAEVSWFPRVSSVSVGGGNYIFVDQKTGSGGDLTFAAIPQDAKELVIFFEFFFASLQPAIQFNGDAGVHYRTIYQQVQDLNGAVTTSEGSLSGIVLQGMASGTNPARAIITIPFYTGSPRNGFYDRSLMADCFVHDNDPPAHSLYRRTNLAAFWTYPGWPALPAPNVTQIKILMGGGSGTARLYKVS